VIYQSGVPDIENSPSGEGHTRDTLVWGKIVDLLGKCKLQSGMRHEFSLGRYRKRGFKGPGRKSESDPGQESNSETSLTGKKGVGGGKKKAHRWGKGRRNPEERIFHIVRNGTSEKTDGRRKKKD